MAYIFEKNDINRFMAKKWSNRPYLLFLEIKYFVNNKILKKNSYNYLSFQNIVLAHLICFNFIYQVTKARKRENENYFCFQNHFWWPKCDKIIYIWIALSVLISNLKSIPYYKRNCPKYKGLSWNFSTFPPHLIFDITFFYLWYITANGFLKWSYSQI